MKHMDKQSMIDKAVNLARKYEVGQLFLIGSALYNETDKINDYDFAVNNMPPGRFFKFYGELMFAMDKNVDLIDLSGPKTKFKEIIIREGKLLYDGKSQPR